MTDIRYLSLFDGIGAAHVASRRLGWKCVALAEIEPAPASVTESHFPDVPNFGDVTADDFIDRVRALGSIAMIVGGPPCFPAGTFITTATGLKPIEEIQVGEMVLTHKLRWRRVLAVGGKVSDTVLLKGQGHHGLITTKEHPFYACEKKSRSTRIAGKPVRETWTEGPDWVEAGDMAGKHWASVAHFPETEPPSIVCAGNESVCPIIDENLMWLAGAYLGDGWIRSSPRRGSVIFGVNRRKADEIHRRAGLCGISVTETQERTGPRLALNGNALAKWMKAHFGHGCDGKRVPIWALGMPENLRRALLDGHIATDGSPMPCIRGHRIATVSRELAFGVKMLVNSLGHASSVHRMVNKRTECVIEGRTVNERPYYTVTVSNSDRTSFQKGGIRFALVRKVQSTGHSEMVFNLEVEEDNSYVADTIIVHNCQDFSVAGLRAGIAGDRGNLTLRYLEIIYAIRPTFGSFTENVPGWFSVNNGHAFGAFLGGLAGEDSAIPTPRAGWPDSGVVDGPGSCIAWRTLDAQGFVPQRRRRVFVLQSWDAHRLDPVRVLLEAKAEAVRHLGDRAGSSPLFPERQGVRGHPAPGGSEGAGVASDAVVGVALRGREGGSTAEITGSVMPALRTGGGGGDKPHVLAFGGNNTGGAIEVATAVNAHGGPCGRMDFESETFVATVNALTANGVGTCGADDNQAQAGHLIPEIDAYQCHGSNVGPMGVLRARNGNEAGGVPFIPVSVTGDITHALNTANGGKGCSEDGTGRGVPTIAYRTSGNCGAWETGDKVDALTTGTDPNSHILAFSSKDHGADAGEISPTLRAMGHDGSHANAGGQVAVAFSTIDNSKINGMIDLTESEVNDANADEANSGKILRDLRQEVGEEAFAKWAIGVIASFWPQEILQSGLLRRFAPKGQIGGGVDRSTCDGQETDTAWTMQEVREIKRARCPPPEWRPSRQQARELDAYMSLLSQQGAQTEGFLCDLWEASEGLGVLRDALSALQVDWRPDEDKSTATQNMYGMWGTRSQQRIVREALHAGQKGRESTDINSDHGGSAHGKGGFGVMAVRRLTPRLSRMPTPPGFSRRSS